MALTRFTTNLRLWSWISLVLFVVPWFLPIWGIKGGAMMPVAVFVILFEFPNHLTESLFTICAFTLIFGIPAISIGWILHCVVVMIGDKMRKRQEHAA